MTATRTIAVVGGTGFVGSAVVRTLTSASASDASAAVDVHIVRAPRSHTHARTVDQLALVAASDDEMVARMRGVDTVVNAAGCSDAASRDVDLLMGANALTPLTLFRSARDAGVRRFVHVSSAAVQGTLDLDESERRQPFSPYARSKCLGEQALLAEPREGLDLVVYRPPSVHGADRRVSQTLVRIASSPLASVAGDGARPTPQVLVENVGAAVAYLVFAADPPAIVLHPWEGMTTGSLLEVLGRGRRPRRIPEPLARLALRCAEPVLGDLFGRRADLRRLELLWFGQGQAPGWLAAQGWTPPVGREGWARLTASPRP